jgi:hypothetical protein
MNAMLARRFRLGTALLLLQGFGVLATQNKGSGCG